MTAVAQRVAEVRRRIAEACRRCGRDAGEVRLVAVSKTQPAAAVAEALAAGVDAVGENRVQEAAAKRPLFPPHPPWHLIGPLQQNKARAALQVFDVIETVDRPAIADRLERLLAATSRVLPVLIEVNAGDEPQKSGVAPAGLLPLVEYLLRHCPHLRLEGLMAIPPYHPDPERSRPYFAALRSLGERVAAATGAKRLELSMGMSEDFEIAIEEGATLVRLGRVIFGERQHISAPLAPLHPC